MDTASDIATIPHPTPSATTTPIDSARNHRSGKRRRFFRGWIVLSVAALGLFAAAPGQSYSAATFKEAMRETLTVSHSSFSAAYLVATLISGACLPFVGRLVDRLGARLLLPIIAVLLGGACIWMSSVQTLFGLFVGFSMVRMLGQGSLSMVSAWLVGHWFERNRGLAMGLLGLGGTLSVMLVPLLNHFLIQHVGWRDAWVYLAFGVWLLLILPAAILVRDRPEDVGLLPDGAAPQHDLQQDAASPADVPHQHLLDRTLQQPIGKSWTVGQACRTATFWKLLIPLCTASLVGTGLVFHQLSIFQEHGLSVDSAVLMFSVRAAVATVFALIFGYLTDHAPARLLLIGSMVCLAIAQGLLFVMDSIPVAVVVASMIGLQGAIMQTTGTAVWVNYYGRLHQGAIRGVVLTFAIVASAFGPLPFALSKDFFGSYDVANMILLLLPVGAAVAVWSAHPPDSLTRHDAAEDSSLLAAAAAEGAH